MQHVAVGIFFRNRTLLLCQRKKGSRYELQWEFPGGKVENGESVEDCLRRELREELSIETGPVERIETEDSEYDDGSSYRVHYCYVRSFSGEPINNVFESVRWFRAQDLPGLNILQGNRTFMDRLLSRPFPR